jgi:hypothetical protein
VNQALFGVYNTGALCLQLDTESVYALTSGAFTLSAGTLNTLSGQRLEVLAPSTAPAVVAVVPSQPPVARFVTGAEGGSEIVLDWDRVIVSFYVYIWDRFARVFAVQTDVSLTLAVALDADTQAVELTLTDGPTIDGFEETYSELLPGVAFDEVLDSLLGLALDQLLGDQLSFSFDLGLDGVLSDATGIPLALDFHGIETIDVDGEGEFLNLYFSLLDGTVQPRSVAMPGALVITEQTRGALRLGGKPMRLSEALELLARADQGAWRGPLRPTDGFVVLSDPKLAFVGQHNVEVRARPAGSTRGWTSLPSLSMWHDPIAPRVRLVRQGDRLIAQGSDEGSSAAALQYAWAHDGTWGEFGDVTTTDLLPLVDVRRVSVRARDGAGNVSIPATVDLHTRALRVDRLAPSTTDSGCAASSATSTTAAWFALLALGLWRVGVRRRSADQREG